MLGKGITRPGTKFLARVAKKFFSSKFCQFSSKTIDLV